MTPRIFTPIHLAGKPIHRVALAPLTRMRASPGAQAPRNPMVSEYYEQRASAGGLLITFVLSLFLFCFTLANGIISEATFIAKEAGGYPLAPGIHSAEQIEQWKEVTSAVHKKGSIIALQLWALGRANSKRFFRLFIQTTVLILRFLSSTRQPWDRRQSGLFFPCANDRERPCARRVVG